MDVPRGHDLANSTWRRTLLSRRVAAHRRTEEASAEPDIGVRLAVRQAVAELPRRQRGAIVLRYFVDLPVFERAECVEAARLDAASHNRDLSASGVFVMFRHRAHQFE